MNINISDRFVDTHRHHGGSTPVEFIMLAMEKGACELRSKEEVVRNMVCSYDETHPTFNRFQLFLQKFKILDKIKWTEELIDHNIKLVCQNMEKENIHAAFMDFSVSKYRHIGWSLSQAIQFILDSFKNYTKIPIYPILSIKYESPEDAQYKICKIIDDPKVGDKICGIDFVGDESKFNPKVQSKLCDMWKNRFVRLHVGESEPIDNIIETLKFPNVTSIAHGIKIIESPELMKNMADSNILFDIAPSSNYMTGVVPVSEKHPALVMCNNGLKLTIGSDDPVQCDTHLHKEYSLLIDQGLNESQLYDIQRNGIIMSDRWSNFAISS